MKKFAAVFLACLLLLAVQLPSAAAESSQVDTNKLQSLMAIVEKAKEDDYTPESWAVVAAAMENAYAAQDGKDQKVVDEATAALAKALSQIARKDYKALDEAVGRVAVLLDEDAQSLWLRLAELVSQREELKDRGDPAAVAEATREIQEILAELEAYSGSIDHKEEPPVVWMVLFFVSLALNAALVTLLALKVLNKHGRKKYQRDDVPLVDYDIDDDIV